MLSKNWRIVLLVVTLVAMIWPSLLGSSTWWVSLVAVVLLLISELSCSGCCEAHVNKMAQRPVKKIAKKTAKKVARKRRR